MIYTETYGESEAARFRHSPAVILGARLTIDGNQWCALYGDSLQEGVAGFGDSPAAAYHDFNKAWFARLSERPQAETVAPVPTHETPEAMPEIKSEPQKKKDDDDDLPF